VQEKEKGKVGAAKGDEDDDEFGDFRSPVVKEMEEEEEEEKGDDDEVPAEDDDDDDDDGDDDDSDDDDDDDEFGDFGSPPPVTAPAPAPAPVVQDKGDGGDDDDDDDELGGESMLLASMRSADTSPLPALKLLLTVSITHHSSQTSAHRLLSPPLPRLRPSHSSRRRTTRATRTRRKR
jgi:hypothetical protein